MKNIFFKTIKQSVKHWYLPLIVGILLVGTGVWTFTSPLQSYLALSLLFSITFLFSGIIEIVFAISNRKHIDSWGWTLVLGVLNTLVGIMLLQNPEISVTTLPLYVGFVIMFRSFGAIGTAIDLRNYGNIEWGTLMIFGIFALLFSFILIWNPLFAGMSIVIWTGLSLITSGTFNIYLAIKMKNIHKDWDRVSDEIKNKYDEIHRKFQSEFKD